MAHLGALPLPSRSMAPGLAWGGHALVWFLVFIGAFVINEPAPYELLAIPMVASAFLFGLQFRAGVLPLIYILILFISGGMVAMFQAEHFRDASMFVVVSGFLAATSIFFACYVAADPLPRSTMIFNAYTAGAILAAIAGIVGYFDIGGSGEIFTLYGRAKGTFQDPNVLGPFLVPPIVWCIQHMLRGRASAILFYGPIAAVLMFGVLLTFSRGAWGHTALSVIIMAALWFFLARNAVLSMRIMIYGMIGIGILAAGIAVALAVPQIGDLLNQRATLTQDYDTGNLGRFGRHILGFWLALDNPLGIGAREFAHIFPEDPHNVFLNAAMSYGWVGFFAYVSLIVVTIGRLFVVVLENPALRPISIAVLASIIPLSMMGTFIDTDHWRHFYLLFGLSWGLIAAASEMAMHRSLEPGRVSG